MYWIASQRDEWTPEEFFNDGKKAWDRFKGFIGPHLPPLNVRVGEIGCGAGRVLYTAAQEFTYAVGWDISKPMLDLGRRLLPKSNIDWVLLQDPRLPKQSTLYDLIFSIACFQHFYDEAWVVSYIKTAYHLLVNSGTLAIMMPDWRKAPERGPRFKSDAYGAVLQEKTQYELLNFLQPQSFTTIDESGQNWIYILRK